MPEPIIFEDPNFSHGSYVQFKGRVDDIEEWGITLKINEFTKVLIPLTESQYNEVLGDDGGFETLDSYYENPVILEVEIDSSGAPVFRSISIDKFTDISFNDEILFEGSVMPSLCGNFIHVKNNNSRIEVCLRIPPSGTLRDKVTKIIMNKKFSPYSYLHPSLVKVKYTHPRVDNSDSSTFLELTDISIERL